MQTLKGSPDVIIQQIKDLPHDTDLTVTFETTPVKPTFKIKPDSYKGLRDVTEEDFRDAEYRG